MTSASKNMASMSHCCGFVQALQHRLAEVVLLGTPLRLGVPLPDIALSIPYCFVKGELPSEPSRSRARPTKAGLHASQCCVTAFGQW